MIKESNNDSLKDINTHENMNNVKRCMHKQ